MWRENKRHCRRNRNLIEPDDCVECVILTLKFSFFLFLKNFIARKNNKKNRFVNKNRVRKF